MAYLQPMQRRWLWGGLLVAALCGCNGDLIPIDPREDAPLGDMLPIDEELSLDGLQGPVDAVRDEWGRMHIYATNAPDAMLVQGYLVARDRHIQLDLFRRFATGRLTEVFGELEPTIIETDITFRSVGLARVAAEIYAQSSDETRAKLDAYASGVSQLYAEIRSGERPIVGGVVTSYKPEHFTDWTGADSLAVGRFFSHLLSYDLDTGNTALLEDLRTTFASDAADPELAARAGIERDYILFAPPDGTTVIDGLEDIGAGTSSLDPPGFGGTPQPRAAHPQVKELLATTNGYERALLHAREVMAKHGDFGSNNWAIGGQRTASGRAMLGSDPHLALTAPSVFWPVSIHVGHRGLGPKPKDVDVAGISFAGTPGIVLGHNANVAWGATVAGYDVTDVYAETLTTDGKAVMFKGKEVAIETIEEVIVDHNGNELIYEVQIVPHHGPIIPNIVNGQVVPPDPELGAVSVRWTGLEPTFEVEAINGLATVEDVEEGRMALEGFEVGAQNWVLADTNGDILWTTHSHVPYRDDRALAWNPDTYEGSLPCLLLPGDGTAEWTGRWAPDAVPWAKNPSAGFLSTANGDQVGGTLDNDPSDDVQPDGSSAYLGCSFAYGFRQGRVRELIEDHPTPITLDDMSAMQADHRSPLGARMVPALLLAIDSARQHAAGAITRPDLDVVVSDSAYDSARIDLIEEMLETWRDESEYRAESGVDPDTNEPLSIDTAEARGAQATLFFNVFLVRFMARVFGDELGRIGRSGGTLGYVPAILHLLESEAASLATYDAATGDSILWDDVDTSEMESRQDRMIRALLDALAWLDEEAGAMADWRWGIHHRIHFKVPNGIPWDLTIPRGNDPLFAKGFPRHGDMYNVDAANFDAREPVDGALDFTYDSGPTQRFVIEMDPSGVKSRNALPGGAVWERESSHYADEAELWRKNETHDVPFYLDEVIEHAESRTLIAPTSTP
jgi:penicillin amidase